LLLVNDGSTDGSERIAEKHARRRPERIRYLTHPGQVNRGMSATRNLGLENANGEFVAFLDADDVWVPHKLAEQVALMDAHPEADMLCGGTMYWATWSDVQKEEDFPYVAGDIRPADSGPRQRRLPLGQTVDPPTCIIETYPLGEGAAPSMSNLILRRELARRVGGFEETFRGMYEDQVFLAKVYLSGKVLFSDRLWDYYRQHGKSCMASTNFEQHYQARESYLYWIDNYLQSHPEADPQSHAVIQGKLDEAWRHWHSTSLKRRLIQRAEKLLPPSFTIRAHIVWCQLREILSSCKPAKQ
jgi:glycosyltransferase involved in cell wall biosynthesis